MLKILSQYKYQLFLILIGAIWLVFLYQLMQVEDQQKICNDCESYLESASLLYHNFKVHYYRPIGMAIITGLPYLFGGSDDAVLKFSLQINILAWLGSGLLLFAFLKQQVSEIKAFCITLLYFSIFGCAFVNFQVLTESLFIFLMMSVFYFLEKYQKEKRYYFLSIAISLLLFLMLVKPGVKFLAILFLLYFGKTLLKKFNIRETLFIYFSLSLIALHCIKMKKEYGNYTISYIDIATYYNYLGNKALCFKANDTLDLKSNKRYFFLEKIPFDQKRNVASNDLLSQLSDNKLNLLKAYLSDILENTKTPSGSIYLWKNVNNKSYYDMLSKGLIMITKYQNRFFTLLGFVLALYYVFKSNKQNYVYSLMGLYILYTIATSGISYSEGDRFHIVFFPFVILLMVKFYIEKVQNGTL